MSQLISVRTFDGLNLSVREWPGYGTPCVLIHGVAEGNFIWNSFAEEIAAYSRVIAIDLRGHGASDWDAKKNYSFDTHVADVVRVLDQLNLDNYILVGHSLGGSVAAKIVALRPKDVLASVFVDTGPVSDPSAAGFLYDQIVDSYQNYRSVAEYAAWLGQRRFLASKESLNSLAQDSLICAAESQYRLKFDVAVAAIVLHEHDEAWWWAALSEANVPILIVRGIGSAVLPKDLAVQMANTAPNAELVTVELAGHSVMNDNPVGFSQAVKPFLFARLQFANAIPA